jgi:isochorismate synthase/2-succinyl-5-enolpyruvyl-6-hydroxy-3-cyclohexene-1-carboxylate synthase/2-succinyl-6-hydroxy-2,4-cyclohexadiene-1-carboxylate synthase/O-succinylbenzoate synthase
MQGLASWESSKQPFTSVTLFPHHLLATSPDPAAHNFSSSVSAQAGGLGASTAMQSVLSAQRGLLVVAEMMTGEDSVAAAQLARVLGWPVVADVLSGLRVGASPSFPCIAYFDHLLLDQSVWGALQPDVVVILGGHLTSKRTAQFLEWCALGGEGRIDSMQSGSSSACTTHLIHVDAGPQRHDQSHLLSARVQAPLPLFAAAVGHRMNMMRSNFGSAAAQQEQQQRQQQGSYTQLLLALEAEVGSAVGAELDAMEELTEPHVARLLAQLLPHGDGLFLGNSMPIRDFDMYAAPRPSAHSRQSVNAAATTTATTTTSSSSSSSSSGSSSSSTATWQPLPAHAAGKAAFGDVGARVAANRGASGIDGVLSTAAGFADGLGRGCTLVVGDISFLHDINGLSLLRNGESHGAGGRAWSVHGAAPQIYSMLPSSCMECPWASTSNLQHGVSMGQHLKSTACCPPPAWSVHGPAPQIYSMLPSSCMSFSVSHLAVSPSPFSWYIHRAPPPPPHTSCRRGTAPAHCCAHQQRRGRHLQLPSHRRGPPRGCLHAAVGDATACGSGG